MAKMKVKVPGAARKKQVFRSVSLAFLLMMDDGARKLEMFSGGLKDESEENILLFCYWSNKKCLCR